MGISQVTKASRRCMSRTLPSSPCQSAMNREAWIYPTLLHCLAVCDRVVVCRGWWGVALSLGLSRLSDSAMTTCTDECRREFVELKKKKKKKKKNSSALIPLL